MTCWVLQQSKPFSEKQPRDLAAPLGWGQEGTLLHISIPPSVPKVPAHVLLATAVHCQALFGLLGTHTSTHCVTTQGMSLHVLRHIRAVV